MSVYFVYKTMEDSLNKRLQDRYARQNNFKLAKITNSSCFHIRFSCCRQHFMSQSRKTNFSMLSYVWIFVVISIIQDPLLLNLVLKQIEQHTYCLIFIYLAHRLVWCQLYISQMDGKWHINFGRKSCVFILIPKNTLQLFDVLSLCWTENKSHSNNIFLFPSGIILSEKHVLATQN